MRTVRQTGAEGERSYFETIGANPIPLVLVTESIVPRSDATVTHFGDILSDKLGKKDIRELRRLPANTRIALGPLNTLIVIQD
jgi:hypothetical protein